MQRNIVKVIAVAALAAFSATSFADEAQPELQPKRLEFSWFKQPVDTTSYVSFSSSVDTKRQDFRFITDYSPQ